MDAYKQYLRNRIIRALKAQGFTIENNKLIFHAESKSDLRKIHSDAVNYIRTKKSEFIRRYEPGFIQNFIADGDDVEPSSIEPILVEVKSRSQSDLFKWVRLHWSIPTSAGYGRRLRFLVMDRQNGKLIGIIGLGDPVIALKARDEYIGWSPVQRNKRLKHVMDAFILGSVPPYSLILGGKLVASLVASNEVSETFKKKYGGKETLISKEIFDGTLAAVTTISALGKSSMYDRLTMFDKKKVKDGPKYIHVGWTAGSGEFPFINSLYDELLELVKKENYTGKKATWGSGVRSRRYVIHKALKLLDLPTKFLYHGVKREVFIVNMGTNWREFLNGTAPFRSYDLTVEDISEFILRRWVIPRSERDHSYLDFQKEEYALNGCTITSSPV